MEIENGDENTVHDAGHDNVSGADDNMKRENQDTCEAREQHHAHGHNRNIR